MHTILWKTLVHGIKDWNDFVKSLDLWTLDFWAFDETMVFLSRKRYIYTNFGVSFIAMKTCRSFIIQWGPRSAASALLETVRNKKFWSVPQTYWIKFSGGGTHNLCCNNPSMWFGCTLKFENHCCVYQSLGDLVKMHILIQWVWCGPEFLISGRHPSGDDVGPQTILEDQGFRSFAYKCYKFHVFNKKNFFSIPHIFI